MDRLGVDLSKLGIPYNYELVGTEVDWLNLVPKMKFDRNNYIENLKTVYKRLG